MCGLLEVKAVGKWMSASQVVTKDAITQTLYSIGPNSGKITNIHTRGRYTIVSNNNTNWNNWTNIPTVGTINSNMMLFYDGSNIRTASIRYNYLTNLKSNVQTQLNSKADYESGTWTPTSSISSITLSDTLATYVKIGKLVIANCSFTINGTASSGSSLDIRGLPFVCDTGISNSTVNKFAGIWFYSSVVNSKLENTTFTYPMVSISSTAFSFAALGLSGASNKMTIYSVSDPSRYFPNGTKIEVQNIMYFTS